MSWLRVQRFWNILLLSLFYCFSSVIQLYSFAEEQKSSIELKPFEKRNVSMDFGLHILFSDFPIMNCQRQNIFQMFFSHVECSQVLIESVFFVTLVYMYVLFHVFCCLCLFSFSFSRRYLQTMLFLDHCSNLASLDFPFRYVQYSYAN